MTAFSMSSIPSQNGRIAIVTGANIGLGYETALALAATQMKVVMACRNLEKAENARKQILAKVPRADLEVIQIDLSSLKSVRAFAETYTEKHEQLDLLINNAGVMIPPYTVTEDGFELQMGANHLGHFLLTGLLFPTIRRTPGARVVSLSSNAHKRGKINFDDLHSKKKYSAIDAYSQSKLACLMFGFELQRRLESAGVKDVKSVIAHPGVSETNLFQYLPSLVQTILRVTVVPLFTHAPDKAAQPTLLAALGDDVKGGEYFGPTGLNEMKGLPGKAKATALARNSEIAARLWEVSERETGFVFEV